MIGIQRIVEMPEIKKVYEERVCKTKPQGKVLQKLNDKIKRTVQKTDIY